MRIKRTPVFHLAGFALLFFCASVFAASPVGTAFVYQGRLTASNAPASGVYDFQFTLYDAVASGNIVGDTVEIDALGVTNGLFVTPLDFGALPYNGNALWLGVAVRTNGSSTFVGLAPRQPVTSVPYAIAAQSVLAGGVQGTLNQTNLATDVALLDRTLQVFTGQNDFDANVGLGTSIPDRPLSIGGSGVNGEWISFQQSGGPTVWHLNNFSNGLNFAQTGVADFRLFLSANGNVGVGANFPTNKLTVNGTVGLVNPNNQDIAMGSPERLRVIRGVFFPTGQIAAGSGFTVTSNSFGAFTVNFSPAFSGYPAVTANAVSGAPNMVSVSTLGVNIAQLSIFDNTGAHVQPTAICFTAVGAP